MTVLGEMIRQDGIEIGRKDGIEIGKKAGIKIGKEEGLARGIQEMILDNLEEGVSENRILEKLCRRFDLSYEKAKEYFDNCCGKNIE